MLSRNGYALYSKQLMQKKGQLRAAQRDQGLPLCSLLGSAAALRRLDWCPK